MHHCLQTGARFPAPAALQSQRGSLFPAACISLYTMYLAYSALQVGGGTWGGLHVAFSKRAGAVFRDTCPCWWAVVARRGLLVASGRGFRSPLKLP